MDKYEMNLKIEQIKQLAAKKSYKEAAAIAKEMSWHKVKDWNALATVINVQEAVGDYEEARDMAILAYNRNLGGRKLVYKLTEIMIKLKQFDDADGLYEEYERMSQHDVSRYILYYILRKEKITALIVTHDISEAISMSDRVIVLSERPATVKTIHKIDFEMENRTPLNCRENPKFSKYFNLMWKELGEKNIT